MVLDVCAVKGKLFERLYKRGVWLTTRLRKNIKTILMGGRQAVVAEAGGIESANDVLKNVRQVEHSRRRRPVNFLVNLEAGLIEL
ncbi:MAG: transposase [Treponema sp.]|jgi:hypothetical protein|nr:transposase [Treponema sp.]